MPLAGFEPTIPGSERQQTRVLDRAVTGLTLSQLWRLQNCKSSANGRRRFWANFCISTLWILLADKSAWQRTVVTSGRPKPDRATVVRVVTAVTKRTVPSLRRQSVVRHHTDGTIFRTLKFQSPGVHWQHKMYVQCPTVLQHSVSHGNAEPRGDL
jgi:hypothetical protein